MPQKVRNEKVLTLVRDALIFWGTKALSQAGRLLVANQIILASLWYLTSTADIGLKTLKISQGLVRVTYVQARRKAAQELGWPGIQLWHRLLREGSRLSTQSPKPKLFCLSL